MGSSTTEELWDHAVLQEDRSSPWGWPVRADADRRVCRMQRQRRGTAPQVFSPARNS